MKSSKDNDDADKQSSSSSAIVAEQQRVIKRSDPDFQKSKGRERVNAKYSKFMCQLAHFPEELFDEPFVSQVLSSWSPSDWRSCFTHRCSGCRTHHEVQQHHQDTKTDRIVA